MEENKLAESFYKSLEEEKGFPKASLLKVNNNFFLNLIINVKKVSIFG